MAAQVDIEHIISILKEVIPADKMPVTLHEPSLQGNEQAYLMDCINSTYVSYVGKYVDQFEAMLADFTGAKRAIAMVSGTAALQVALRLAGVEPGDEVLMPALTFISTANAISYNGAIPHFVDSEERTLGLDPRKLASYLKGIARVDSDSCRNKVTGRRIRVVVPVHVFGHPVDLDVLASMCDEYKIVMVEDAAESLGSYYKGKHTGNWGRMSILSFNGNKTITTGGGGALITNDEELGKMAKHLTTTAKIPHRWEYRHDFIGYNYRLPNVNAAIGCAQMERLPEFLENKRLLAKSYQSAFEGIVGVSVFREPSFAKSNYWLNVILLNEDMAGLRDEVLMRTNDEGIMTRPAWTLINKLAMFKDCPSMDLHCAESLAKRIINIPSSPFLAMKSSREAGVSSC